MPSAVFQGNIYASVIRVIVLSQIPFLLIYTVTYGFAMIAIYMNRKKMFHIFFSFVVKFKGTLASMLLFDMLSLQHQF